MPFRSFASERFWRLYSELPKCSAWRTSNTNCSAADPFHPSLHLKQVGEVWSARIGQSHRVIGYREGDKFYWGWIGSHEAYNKLLRKVR